jgi:hypothetical protein
MMPLLRPEHADHLRRFHIPHGLLEAAGVRSVTDAEARETLGLHGHQGADLGGILFPYLSPTTGLRGGGRIRLDNPLSDGAKYISEPGCRHFFFAPGVVGFLKDTSIPAVLVEAEKSALAITALADRAGRKFLVIAIGGCWGWKRTIGKRSVAGGGSESETGPGPDLDLVTWEERPTVLAFDSNALTNPKVQRARGALAHELAERAASVLIADIPAIKDVNGPDDLIAISGDDAMLQVLDSARPVDLDVIRLEPGKLPNAVDQAEEVLVRRSKKLFQRAGELARVITLPEPSKGGGLQRSKRSGGNYFGAAAPRRRHDSFAAGLR